MQATNTTTTAFSDVPRALLTGSDLLGRRARHEAVTPRSGQWLTRLAVGLAGTRALLGCAALAAPEAAGRVWIGQGASGRDRAVLVRALGGRDLALGLGALLALRSRRDVRQWLLMGAASDVVDTAGSAAGFAALPPRRRWLVLAASGGAACAGAVLAARLSTRS